MSEPRKDVKLHLDADVHAALSVICNSRGVGLGEYIESIVAPHVRAMVHDVNVMAGEFLRLGISGNHQESPGMAGRDRE